MIKAIIVDDETNNQELISNLLKSYADNIQVVGLANSVETAYNAIMEHHPDLIFLDIQMPDGTGFDLLKKFDKINFKIIFVTAHQEFAIEAFKYSALDYLLKPLSPTNLIEAVKKVEESMSSEDLNLKLKILLSNMAEPIKNKKKIVLKTMERIYSVDIDDIIRLESDGGYTKVYLVDGKRIMVSRTMKEFDDLLIDVGFLRVHHSHLVNMNHLFCFEKSEGHLVMKDESIVPVSNRKKDQLLELLNML
ncbi:MAG: DNA-binding response regulator [Bacteroidetes bacterium]|jgi:two-component system LytT family response regulator|nr:DNA-binding response regulator [Bacteroidota bacterium]MDF2452358.1 DNA-binding response regulator [Bacteroidota bacterium]